MTDPEGWQIFLAGMASGGTLALLIIRAEMWWIDRKRGK